MITTLIWLAIAATLGVYLVFLHKGLVALGLGVAAAWDSIDALLRQRHGELPRLLETCRALGRFEGETLDGLAAAQTAAEAARRSDDVAGVGSAEGRIRLALGTLAAAVQACPELKANATLQQLLGRCAGIENAIADRREFYNEAVDFNNARIAQFPDLIVARLCGFRPAVPLEFGIDGEPRTLFPA